ncbi:MAG TPA: ABC transporter substrate-binding protein [Amycolatopsis sp.]|nr:ABC transporter substrate-binding protein [Amycolatopsis sp.]
MKRFKAYIAGLAVIGLVVSACGGGSAGSGQGGGAGSGQVDRSASLSVTWITPPQGVDPALECHIGCRAYWLPVFETLYDIDKDANPVPFAAAAMPAYSADGLQLTIPLRPGRTFHDGTPIDAAAVKTDLERAKTLPKSTAAADLTIVKSVDVVDQWTAKITLSRPRPDFQAVLSGPAGALISPAAIASGRNLAIDPGNAGSGPYLLTSLTPNNKAVYSAVPNYWKPELNQVASLTINGIPDTQTAVNAVQSGTVDAAYGANLLNERKQTLTNAGLKVIQTKSYNLEAILLRSSRGDLSNQLVREALASAIDRDTINKTIYSGTCDPTSQVYPDPLPAHVPNYDPYPYNPDKAKALLAQAGRPNGISFNIVTVSGGSESTQNAQVVQQMLSKVGVQANLTPMNSVDGVVAFNRDQLDARSTVVTFRADSLGSIDYGFSPDGPIHMSVGDGADQLSAMTAQLAKAGSDQQNQILQQMGKFISDKAYVIPICFQSQSWAAKPKVVGFDNMGYARYGVLDPRMLAVTK